MPKARAKRSGGVAVVLPQRLAASLHIEEGGYVDVEEVKGGVLLKPLSAAERRKAALGGIHALQARVRPSPEMKHLTPEAQEKAIAAILDKGDE